MEIEFIQGQKFRALADNQKIFYRDTHSVNSFFRNECPTTPFILVSHNSDGAIRLNDVRNYDADLELMPWNCMRWFGQNHEFFVEYHDWRCKRLVSLPIGLENSEWFPELRKMDKMKELISAGRGKKKLLYVNHNVANFPSERIQPYNLFSEAPYATVDYGLNGSGFDNYIENINSHDFMISPRGNGIDTHRLWECLYLGCIPIEKENLNNVNFWEDFPICLVDDWNEINEKFLHDVLAQFKLKTWNMERLDFKYWKKLIHDAALMI